VRTVDSQTCGGVEVTTVASDAAGVFDAAGGPYAYALLTLSEGDSHRVDGYASSTILCKSSGNGSLELDGEGTTLADGDSAQAEDYPLSLKATGGPVMALVAGVRRANAASRSLTVTRAGQHYRVTKPWGHELWLNGEHPAYCLKELRIAAGGRTSLQYHRQKEETIVLFSGRLRLTYKAAPAVGNDSVSADDLAGVILPPISVMHVRPGVLHRLEAVTDVFLYEASTPHLDDVIRVADDTARHHGRWASEHEAQG